MTTAGITSVFIGGTVYPRLVPSIQGSLGDGVVQILLSDKNLWPSILILEGIELFCLRQVHATVLLSPTNDYFNQAANESI